MASTLLSSEPAAAELPTPRGSSCESADRRGGRRPKPRNRLALQNHCYGNSPLLSPLTQTVWGLNAPQRPGRNVRASTASFGIGETDADTQKPPFGRHGAPESDVRENFALARKSPRAGDRVSARARLSGYFASWVDWRGIRFAYGLAADHGWNPKQLA